MKNKYKGFLFYFILLFIYVGYIFTHLFAKNFILIISYLFRFILPLFICDILFIGNKEDDSIKVLHNKKAIYPFIIIYGLWLTYLILNVRFDLINESSNPLSILTLYASFVFSLLISFIWKFSFKSFNYKISFSLFFKTIIIYLAYFLPAYSVSGYLRLNGIFNGNYASYIVDSCRTIIYPAFTEEFLYRGLLITGLLGLGLDKTKVNIIQSIIFGLLHFGQYQGMGAFLIIGTFGQMLLGYLLGEVYFKTKSLTPCILLHTLLDVI